MPVYEAHRLIHTTLQMLFIITLVLLFCGFKNKRLSSCGSPTSIKAVFPFILLLALYLLLHVHSGVIIIVIVTIIAVGWVFVIAPLWGVTSKTGKIVAGILSYPGVVIVGGWPLTFAPGILALPFGGWHPSPSMTFVLKIGGYMSGFRSSLILDSFSLILWVLLFGVLLPLVFPKTKLNNAYTRKK